MGHDLSDKYARWRLRDALREHPELGILPHIAGTLVLAGGFRLRAESGKHGTVEDEFQLSICVPETFPEDLPLVRETGGRIPKDFHTNPGEDTLCLGAPIGLADALAEDPTLPGFIRTCLVPFLYQFCFFECGKRLPLGELPHGDLGLLEYYAKELGMPSHDAALRSLELLGMKRRIANKCPCPCGSGKRLGHCHGERLNALRVLKPRSWFRKEHSELSKHRR